MRSPLRLLADIGGTNARFVLQEPGQVPRDLMILQCRDFEGPAAAARAYLAGRSPEAAPELGAFSVASPVLGDRIRMTNRAWTFSIEETRSALGLDRLAVINDFAATALAVPSLKGPDLRPLAGGGHAVADAPVAVLGPGTGLGMATLVPGNGTWTVLAGEGGHASLPVTNPREIALLVHLQGRFDHVSAERVLSGPGMVLLHEALAVLDGGATETGPIGDPAWISENADRCPVCAASLEMFSALLGSVAGNFALTVGALGGVYIAGGIVPQLAARFDQAAFRRAFEAKGRFRDYLAKIPVQLILDPVPALKGLAQLLDQEA